MNKNKINYICTIMCYVVARAYSIEQQNAGQAHAWLCHASSLFGALLSS